jgi:hypothetical protein
MIGLVRVVKPEFPKLRPYFLFNDLPVPNGFLLAILASATEIAVANFKSSAKIGVRGYSGIQ